MQSNNPIFRRSEEFQRGGSNPNAGGTMTDPSQWQVGTPGGGGYAPAPAATGPMTIDSVVQKTAITLGVVILTAMATWILTPDVVEGGSTDNLGPLFAAVTIGSLGAFVLSMVNSFKRAVSPALILAFAALEGVALGAISKLFEVTYGGIVVNAVLGTFGAFAGTLAAYKVLNIQVGDKFRRGVIAAVFGMVGISLLSLVLSLFGVNIGIFGSGPLGVLFAVAGLVLGIFMLILDFDFVEQGIANRIPEVESWRAAFAMTVSLVWIYTNLLRLLAIFSDN
ncbi:Bax inhibitor-1/YccA family protein [Nocardioides anomalus]|uniref:Bax inhibitor-1/YccA family protein n=1 Tax=Nocardioides anomalus TaxID=2712223 RepID=A0A6G6WH06_9ACTN|nr:Bax inhibitor-1/YccA family protein [Nocardioides anomalus]QIG44375.1 Bax inhibitor-1/YccA family protein [Nocardioides anomalus]